MAVELVGSIRSQLQVELPISEFMQASNIATLAAILLKQFAPDVATIEVTANVLNLHEQAVLDAEGSQILTKNFRGCRLWNASSVQFGSVHPAVYEIFELSQARADEPENSYQLQPDY